MGYDNYSKGYRTYTSGKDEKKENQLNLEEKTNTKIKIQKTKT